jgi:hypothetical protein
MNQPQMIAQNEHTLWQDPHTSALEMQRMQQIGMNQLQQGPTMGRQDPQREQNIPYSQNRRYCQSRRNNSSALNLNLSYQEREGKLILLFEQHFAFIKVDVPPRGFMPQNLSQLNKTGYPDDSFRAEIAVLSDCFDWSTNIGRLFLLGCSKNEIHCLWCLRAI